MNDIIKLGLGAVLGVIVLVGFIIILNFFSVWIRALFSGARVTFTELIALRLRNVPVGLVVPASWSSLRGRPRPAP